MILTYEPCHQGQCIITCANEKETFAPIITTNRELKSVIADLIFDIGEKDMFAGTSYRDLPEYRFAADVLGMKIMFEHSVLRKLILSDDDKLERFIEWLEETHRYTNETNRRDNNRYVTLLLSGNEHRIIIYTAAYKATERSDT